jgi:hypothetical protein
LEAARAREAFSLTLTTTEPATASLAEALADYYDDQIRELVARLESQEPALLEQIRNEALPTRIVAVLRAIERHTAALTSRPGLRGEAHFRASYRQHVIEHHGKLEPADSDRRRRVPIGEIYVPTVIQEEEPNAEQAAAPHELDVWQLAAEIDRSVLLGDPGGGKTTAANVLMHHFANGGLHSDQTWRVPFLVTLRKYAATHPPERSVARHIEHNLETLYQCPPPPGLVDLLLLTGRAVVIFDGLDELIDTSRRKDVADRVERFCSEYPLAVVLVTSRLIGYDQARLDENLFTCYRLGGFAEDQVGEYVRRWFAQDADAGPGDAETFLTESESVVDLRSNPLMLALLCILYRGEGSLPRNRAEVYEHCANLLFHRWDARRQIHQDLRAGHLLEAALRHFADWLFLRDDAQSAVPERDLIRVAAEFLHGRGFEAMDAARDAAREFVEFCRDRIWVFSDAGTTAAGEKLYAFTHRTFLEYFAAAHLAYGNDTPEELARAVAPHVVRSEWLLVAELAVQIKDRTCEGGAQRLYTFLLNELYPDSLEERDRLLRFLAFCLRSVDPSPQCVRELSRHVIEHVCEADANNLRELSCKQVTRTEASGSQLTYLALPVLLTGCGTYRDTVADEIDSTLTSRIESGEQTILVSGIRVMASLPHALPMWDPGDLEPTFWRSRADHNVIAHGAAVAAVAKTDAYIRLVALKHGLITTNTALSMPGGPIVLFQDSYSCFAGYEPYFLSVFRALEGHGASSDRTDIDGDLAAFGQYLLDHPTPPWLHGTVDHRAGSVGPGKDSVKAALRFDGLGPTAYLGGAAITAILSESSQSTFWQPFNTPPGLIPYLSYRKNTILKRRRLEVDNKLLQDLPDMPIPDEFNQTFRDWARCRIKLTERPRVEEDLSH